MKRIFASLVLAVALLAQAPLAHGTAISITAANFLPSSQAVYLAGTNRAGEALTAGQAVYIDTAATVAAGQIKKASSTGTGLSTRVIGFAANGASAGQPVKVVIRDPELTLGGAVTAGAIILLHTAGGVTLTAADVTTAGYVAVMGVGISTTKINFGGTKVSTAQFAGVIRADVAIP